jgi:muconolactone delta-isomerase
MAKLFTLTPKNSELASWLTKPEVAQVLARSEKTVERLDKEGRLRKAYRPVPGRKAIPVFDPKSVTALQQEIDELYGRPE